MHRHLANAIAIAAAVLLAAAAGTATAATLDLRFKQPEKFADIGWGSVERERHLDALRDEFQHLAARLPEGQKLQIEVTQVDLAGWVPPSATTPVRVLREGQAQIADMNYLQRSPRGPEGNQSLGYERRMLQRWFTETFPDAAARRTAAAPARAASTP